METTDGREEIQALMLEAEQYKRQMESINRQMQILETTMEELRGSLNAISALEENKAGTEILVSVGSASFIRAKLMETDKILVGVGSALSLEKSIPEARKFFEDRVRQAGEAQEKMRKAALETTDAIQALDDEYRHLISHMQQEKK
ncbi:MAG: prefoldin subunit alpha [Candidatus Altiarchaeia archaeon]